MKLRVERTFGIIILLFLCIFIYANHSVQNKTYSEKEPNTLEEWANKFSTKEKDNRKSVFKHKLKDKIIDNQTLAFRTIHARAQVYADDELIYSLDPVKNSVIKTTGYVWNFVTIPEELAGKTISIHTETIYDEKARDLTCYYGNKSDIEHILLQQSVSSMIVTMSTLMVGICLLLYSVLVLRKGFSDNVLRNLALFSCALGLWRFTEIPYVQMAFPNGVALNILNHASLFCMLLPFALFIKSTYSECNQILWKNFCYFNVACLIIQLLLQLFGIKDLHQTLWMTHVGILILVIITLYTEIRALILYRVSFKVKLQFICLLFVLGSTLLNFAIYALSQYNSTIGATSFLIYIIVMGCDSLKTTQSMIERSKENDIYRKLAFTDEMTELYNRNAFNHDLCNISIDVQKNGLRPVVFMADLNELKKCNDNYGHSYGDSYIKMISETLLHIFCMDARCYRIGGDEFCVLLSDYSQKEIDMKLDTLHKKIQKLNEKGFVVPISLAIGYAVFDPNKDKDLFATKDRADLIMYENKRNMKQALLEK